MAPLSIPFNNLEGHFCIPRET